MEQRDKLPENFPGTDLAMSWTDRYHHTGYLYEVNHVYYAKTTSGDQVLLPYIEYRSLIFVTRAIWGSDYLDSRIARISEALLTAEQQQAVVTAASIENRRNNDDPTLSDFTPIREIEQGEDGLLYVGTPDAEGDFEPFAAVKSLQRLGNSYFANAVEGYYGIFNYNEADIPAFIPSRIANNVNAYKVIDTPRIIIGENDERNFQIARIMLFNVTIDLDYPTESFD